MRNTLQHFISVNCVRSVNLLNSDAEAMLIAAKVADSMEIFL